MEAAAVEIASQRAREETDRFRLPSDLVARIAVGDVLVPSETGSRKRARLDNSGAHIAQNGTDPVLKCLIEAAAGSSSQADDSRTLWRANYEVRLLSHAHTPRSWNDHTLTLPCAGVQQAFPARNVR